jgi:hypothetical protein
VGVLAAPADVGGDGGVLFGVAVVVGPVESERKAASSREFGKRAQEGQPLPGWIS